MSRATSQAQAVAAFQAGRLAEAEQACRAWRAAAPGDAGAPRLLGMVLRRMGRAADALAAYDAALSLEPGAAATLVARANLLNQVGRHEEALADADTSLRTAPRAAPAHNARGLALAFLQDTAAALAAFDSALALDPTYADALLNRGHALVRLGRRAEGIATYDQAISLRSDRPEPYVAKVRAQVEEGDFPAAVATCRAAAAAAAAAAGMQRLLGVWLYARLMICDWDGLDGHLQAIARQISEAKVGIHPFDIIAAPFTAAQQLANARVYAAAEVEPFVRPRPPVPDKPAEARIVLGYVSADFHDHATARLAVELFERHDRTRFEVVALSYGPAQDSPMRRRLEAAFDRFIDVRGRSDQEIASIARAQGLDIAIDLKGYTAHGRPRLFAAGLAPVQVSYLAYPGTLGASCMDYLIADAVIAPPGAESAYAERIERLPHSYQPNDTARPRPDRAPPRAELGLPDEAFVYCSFNSPYKITPDVFAVWMNLLRQVPESVLWILAGAPETATNLTRAAAAHGIDPARLTFADRLPQAQHLARHLAADLFLDSFHCSAHTTASDALWAGLPVLTRLGDTFAGRVGGSLVQAAGLPELVASNTEDYAALALRAARDRDWLAGLRTRLARGDRSPLFDIAAYARDLEAAYERIWARVRSGA